MIACSHCGERSPTTPTGYVLCAHEHCCAIIIGRDGDLCDDCRAHDEAHDCDACDACDSDSAWEVMQ